MTADDVDVIFKVANYLEIWPYFSTTLQTKEDTHAYVDNERSKQAIARIGAKFEGVLRQRMIRKDGTARDTAMFSVIEIEWFEAKKHLEQMLAL